MGGVYGAREGRVGVGEDDGCVHAHVLYMHGKYTYMHVHVWQHVWPCT